MRLLLVSDGQTGIDFFPELSELLGKRVAGLDIESAFVPFPEDIPAKVASVAGRFDLIFVFALYLKPDFRIQALLNKLVDIEIRKKVKIIKAIMQSDAGELGGEQLQKEKERLAEEWSDFIAGFIQNPDSFKPKKREEDDEEAGLFGDI